MSSAQDVAVPAFMYVRVKRERACVFLRCAPGETVGAVKARIEALTQQPAVDQRLLHPDGTVLDDGSTLAEAGISNDAVLGMCYRLPDGTWEVLNIEAYDYGGDG